MHRRKTSGGGIHPLPGRGLIKGSPDCNSQQARDVAIRVWKDSNRINLEGRVQYKLALTIPSMTLPWFTEERIYTKCIELLSYYIIVNYIHALNLFDSFSDRSTFCHLFSYQHRCVSRKSRLPAQHSVFLSTPNAFRVQIAFTKSAAAAVHDAQ